MTPTITTTQAIEVLRANGIRCSPESLKNGIEQGVYSFADVITGSTQPVYLIWSYLMDAWLMAHVGPDYTPCKTVLGEVSA